MTIVPLLSLDTFIRDSLFEVRKGIANSRNASNANSSLGLMVDLPEKVDFEILVTTNYQALTRRVTGQNSEQGSATDIDITLGKSKSGGNETESDSETTSETGTNSSSSNESENSNGNASASGSGSESDSNNKTESTSKNGNESTASSESESSNSNGNKSEFEHGRQGETHKEANDRTSRTFEEEEGEWGGQGQISTPELPGGPVCQC